MNLKKSPLWLWPNTLSLDAPLVAIAWVWMLAHALGVRYFEVSALWILFGVVWAIYITDRMIDSWKSPQLREVNFRHAFAWRFRWILSGCVALTIGLATYYTLYKLPSAMLSAGVAVAFLVFLYLLSITLGKQKNIFLKFLPQGLFALICCLFIVDRLLPQMIFVTGSTTGGITAASLFGLLVAGLVLRLSAYFKSERIPYGKNLAAGLIFALGVAIPARLYQSNSPEVIVDVIYPLIDGDKFLFTGIFDTFYNIAVLIGDHLIRVVGTIETVSFGVLCMLNITAIDLWEHSRKSDNPEVKAANEMTLTMGIMGLFTFLVFYLLMVDQTAAPYFYSILAACAILHLVNRVRTNFTLDAQRVLADIALLAPIPFYYLFITIT